MSLDPRDAEIESLQKRLRAAEHAQSLLRNMAVHAAELRERAEAAEDEVRTLRAAARYLLTLARGLDREDFFPGMLAAAGWTAMQDHHLVRAAVDSALKDPTGVVDALQRILLIPLPSPPASDEPAAVGPENE